MSSVEHFAIEAMEKGWVPDSVVRAGIRAYCKRRLLELEVSDPSAWLPGIENYVALLKQSPVAVHTQAANEQHYELPPEYFELVLGSERKYSSCYFADGVTNLSDAERDSLARSMDRAQIVDGMSILELGCGWGSATLAMAHRFPHSKIVAVSNSKPQRATILERAKTAGLTNIQVITADVAKLVSGELQIEELSAGRFDRVFSIEMFEHVRNYQKLFAWIDSRLKPGGKLFFHVFAHRLRPYLFETEGEDNWMGKYFFTGGQMPSPTLFTRFQDDLQLAEQWWWSGTHYEKTANAWLDRHDAHEERVRNLFDRVYGQEASPVWFQRWRIFYMACAELFGFDNGKEWGVLHCLFEKRAQRGNHA